MGCYTNNILVIGYWPPTNHMLRQFSRNSAQNPGGWRGENWRGRGFDIHAYFPEFDPDREYTDNPGTGEGDFRVDYQDTLADFRRVTAELRPCAIVTFSRGYFHPQWEIEGAAINYDSWSSDAEAPSQPDKVPPDDSVPPMHIRISTLPMEEIAKAINDAHHLDLPAFIDQTFDGFDPYNSYAGSFLSGYLAYLGIWYQNVRYRVRRDDACFAAGHIHVGRKTPVAVATEATEITLEQVIKAVRKRQYSFWIGQIAFRVRTKDEPGAGTDDRVTVTVYRGKKSIAQGDLDLPDFDDLERGDDRLYAYQPTELHLDETPELPQGIGRIPMPYPPTGIEYSHGLEGHFRCRLSISGDDMWLKDSIDIYVREYLLGAGGDPRKWGLTDWFHLGTWGQDRPLSTDPSEGTTSMFLRF